jgi:hypothetical protein
MPNLDEKPIIEEKISKIKFLFNDIRSLIQKINGIIDGLRQKDSRDRFDHLRAQAELLTLAEGFVDDLKLCTLTDLSELTARWAQTEHLLLETYSRAKAAIAQFESPLKGSGYTDSIRELRYLIKEFDKKQELILSVILEWRVFLKSNDENADQKIDVFYAKKDALGISKSQEDICTQRFTPDYQCVQRALSGIKLTVQTNDQFFEIYSDEHQRYVQSEQVINPNARPEIKCYKIYNQGVVELKRTLLQKRVPPLLIEYILHVLLNTEHSAVFSRNSVYLCNLAVALDRESFPEEKKQRLLTVKDIAHGSRSLVLSIPPESWLERQEYSISLAYEGESLPIIHISLTQEWWGNALSRSSEDLSEKTVRELDGLFKQFVIDKQNTSFPLQEKYDLKIITYWEAAAAYALKKITALQKRQTKADLLGPNDITALVVHFKKYYCSIGFTESMAQLEVERLKFNLEQEVEHLKFNLEQGLPTDWYTQINSLQGSVAQYQRAKRSAWDRLDLSYRNSLSKAQRKRADKNPQEKIKLFLSFAFKNFVLLSEEQKAEKFDEFKTLPPEDQRKLANEALKYSEISFWSNVRGLFSPARHAISKILLRRWWIGRKEPSRRSAYLASDLVVFIKAASEKMRERVLNNPVHQEVLAAAPVAFLELRDCLSVTGTQLPDALKIKQGEKSLLLDDSFNSTKNIVKSEGVPEEEIVEAVKKLSQQYQTNHQRYRPFLTELLRNEVQMERLLKIEGAFPYFQKLYCDDFFADAEIVRVFLKKASYPQCVAMFECFVSNVYFPNTPMFLNFALQSDNPHFKKLWEEGFFRKDAISILFDGPVDDSLGGAAPHSRFAADDIPPSDVRADSLYPSRAPVLYEERITYLEKIYSQYLVSNRLSLQVLLDFINCSQESDWGIMARFLVKRPLQELIKFFGFGGEISKTFDEKPEKSKAELFKLVAALDYFNKEVVEPKVDEYLKENSKKKMALTERFLKDQRIEEVNFCLGERKLLQAQQLKFLREQLLRLPCFVKMAEVLNMFDQDRVKEACAAPGSQFVSELFLRLCEAKKSKESKESKESAEKLGQRSAPPEEAREITFLQDKIIEILKGSYVQAINCLCIIFREQKIDLRRPLLDLLMPSQGSSGHCPPQPGRDEGERKSKLTQLVETLAKDPCQASLLLEFCHKWQSIFNNSRLFRLLLLQLAESSHKRPLTQEKLMDALVHIVIYPNVGSLRAEDILKEVFALPAKLQVQLANAVLKKDKDKSAKRLLTVCALFQSDTGAFDDALYTYSNRLEKIGKDQEAVAMLARLFASNPRHFNAAVMGDLGESIKQEAVSLLKQIVDLLTVREADKLACFVTALEKIAELPEDNVNHIALDMLLKEPKIVNELLLQMNRAFPNSVNRDRAFFKLYTQRRLQDADIFRALFTSSPEEIKRLHTLPVILLKESTIVRKFFQQLLLIDGPLFQQRCYSDVFSKKLLKDPEILQMLLLYAPPVFASAHYMPFSIKANARELILSPVNYEAFTRETLPDLLALFGNNPKILNALLLHACHPWYLESLIQETKHRSADSVSEDLLNPNHYLHFLQERLPTLLTVFVAEDDRGFLEGLITPVVTSDLLADPDLLNKVIGAIGENKLLIPTLSQAIANRCEGLAPDRLLSLYNSVPDPREWLFDIISKELRKIKSPEAINMLHGRTLDDRWQDLLKKVVGCFSVFQNLEEFCILCQQENHPLIHFAIMEHIETLNLVDLVCIFEKLFLLKSKKDLLSAVIATVKKKMMYGGRTLDDLIELYNILGGVSSGNPLHLELNELKERVIQNFDFTSLKMQRDSEKCMALMVQILKCEDLESNQFALNLFIALLKKIPLNELTWLSVYDTAPKKYQQAMRIKIQGYLRDRKSFDLEKSVIPGRELFQITLAPEEQGDAGECIILPKDLASQLFGIALAPTDDAKRRKEFLAACDFSLLLKRWASLPTAADRILLTSVILNYLKGSRAAAETASPLAETVLAQAEEAVPAQAQLAPGIFSELAGTAGTQTLIQKRLDELQQLYDQTLQPPRPALGMVS